MQKSYREIREVADVLSEGELQEHCELLLYRENAKARRSEAADVAAMAVDFPLLQSKQA